MSTRQLIVFYRNPELGKVKTRLAAALGDELALAVYLRLAAYTREQVKAVQADKQVYYSDFMDTEDLWTECQKSLQLGTDLGQRMLNAFQNSFSKGYQEVCIIGTDCPYLKADHIHEAFQQLQKHDVVIGPAMDGGYYLLAMREFYPELFQNKSWSTSQVLQATMNDVIRLGLSCHLLEELSDVDEEKDLPENWRKLI